MNERLKELEKLAYVTTEKQVRKGGWDNDREPYEYKTVTETTFSLEKFAELIVRECITVGNADGRQIDYNRDWRIFTYFGVVKE
jgi:hypothetical protein